MRIITILFFTFTQTFNLFSQDKGNFTFEVEADQIYYNQMESLNSFLRDTTDVINSIWFGNDYINDTLVKSSIYGFLLSYQPLNCIDFGIYGRYQAKKFNRTYQIVGDAGGSDPEYYISHILQTVDVSSFIIGLSSNLYLNKLFHFESHSSTFLQRFQLAINLKGGCAFNNFTVGIGFGKTQLMTSFGTHDIEGAGGYMTSYNFRYTSFNGAAELKIGYRIINSQLFSMIGIKAGYQLSGSSIPKDKTERTYNFASNKEELKLNFSGVYYGVYLTIGK